MTTTTSSSTPSTSTSSSAASCCRCTSADVGEPLSTFCLHNPLSLPQSLNLSTGGTPVGNTDLLDRLRDVPAGAGHRQGDSVFRDMYMNFHKVCFVQEEIEIEAKPLRIGKAIAVVSVELRKKTTGKIIARGRHTKYLAVSSKI
ncbi:hypothetical protein RHGRI_023819 [Rhododendron griersonianum]|uniref:Thioesterase domain-containing protein n=1 Tax=Rhododendron griersonianum TaxID=479676 RepID=A0AAV6J582_9ERIC|nr:hypothetical protein RHGRI_023819 [Rhododendron griersonianum]